MRILWIFWAAWASVGAKADWISNRGPEGRLQSFPAGLRGLTGSGDALFAYGDSGIFLSRDGASTWNRWDKGLGPGRISDFQIGSASVFVLKDSMAFACEASGECAALAGGMPRLTDMAVRGAKAYFLGAGDVFLAVDSGGGWSTRRIGEQVGGNQIAATDAYVCVDGGSPGRTGKLSRDDAHWEPLYFPRDGEAQSLDADAKRLYVAYRIGSPYSQGAFFVRADSGNSWEPLPKEYQGGSPDNAYSGFKVLDSGLVAVYDGGKSIYQIQVSDDQGAEWHGSVLDRFQAFIVAGNRARIFAADPGSGNFLVSTDMGRSWKTVDGPRDRQAVRSIAFLKDSLCVIVPAGAGNQTLCSADRGGHWEVAAWTSPYLHTLVGDGRGGLYFYDEFFHYGRLPFDFHPVSPYSYTPDWTSMFAVARTDSVTWAGFTSLNTTVARKRPGDSEPVLLNAGLPRARSSAMVEYRGSLVLATDSGVFRMRDEDTAWMPANPASPTVLGSLASDGKRLFGVADGTFATSPDQGATWEILARPPSGAALSCLAVSGDTLYAVAADGVWIASLSGLPIPESLASASDKKRAASRSRILWESRGAMRYVRRGNPREFGADGRLRAITLR